MEFRKCLQKVELAGDVDSSEEEKVVVVSWGRYKEEASVGTR